LGETRQDLWSVFFGGLQIPVGIFFWGPPLHGSGHIAGGGKDQLNFPPRSR
jgi:hypothetical protein